MQDLLQGVQTTSCATEKDSFGILLPYFVITRLIHEENLGVCDHEITEIMQYTETIYEMKYRKSQT